MIIRRFLAPAFVVALLIAVRLPVGHGAETTPEFRETPVMAEETKLLG